MSFWSSNIGGVIDGSEDASHISTFRVIPDGTTAKASIKQAELTSFNEDKFYQITYKLIDGDYKNSEVRQKIHCFDLDDKKRDRARNMLMRLFKISTTHLKHSDEPRNADLIELKNKVIGIKIQEWQNEGKEGNWVSEIHKIDEHFTSESGIKLQPYNLSKKELREPTAFDRNPKIIPNDLNDDIPF